MEPMIMYTIREADMPIVSAAKASGGVAITFFTENFKDL